MCDPNQHTVLAPCHDWHTSNCCVSPILHAAAYCDFPRIGIYFGPAATDLPNGTVISASYSECWTLCFKRKGCGSFSYQQGTRLCFLKKPRSVQAIEQWSGTRWKDCMSGELVQ